MKKLIEKLLGKIGYMPVSKAIMPWTVEFALGEDTFVDLTLPGGHHRVYGWVDPRFRLPITPENPLLDIERGEQHDNP